LNESASLGVETLASVSQTRIKICGITSVDDALCAAQLGADAIGMVFYSKSPRFVSIEQAREIAFSVGPFVTTVGLFVDETQANIESILERVPLQLLQFHGNESADFCEKFSRPYIKALRMQEGLDLERAIKEHLNAVGILLDAYRPGVPGGTGETFDWDRVPKQCVKPIIVAGGLHPDNVADAVKVTQAYAVDVSGGVEKAPGKKDANKISAFISNARTIHNEQ
jgi:phosphoribosylanthranilate isomerase